MGIFPARAASTSDLAREKLWADEIVDAVVVGNPVWLTADKVKFLSLYAKPSAPSRRGIILVHGRGVHPAWGFIENLRIDFSEMGWHTLSLQMPILRADAPLAAYGVTFPEAFDRIDSGIKYLKKHGVTHIILIGHSTGALTVMDYLSGRPQTPLAGIVAIGTTSVNNGNAYMQPQLSVAKIHRPVLDIFGSEDVSEVVDFAPARLRAAKAAGNNHYTQIRVQGADHFFSDKYDDLKDDIARWLARN